MPIGRVSGLAHERHDGAPFRGRGGLLLRGPNRFLGFLLFRFGALTGFGVWAPTEISSKPSAEIDSGNREHRRAYRAHLEAKRAQLKRVDSTE